MTSLTPETAARDALREAITAAINADRIKHAAAGTRASGAWFSESHAEAVWAVVEPEMAARERLALAALDRLDAEVAAARLTLTEREVDYQAALAENAALRAENATIQRAWDTAFDRGVEAGANDAERDAALAVIERVRVVEKRLRWAEFGVFQNDYERGRRHAEDDIKRTLFPLLWPDSEGAKHGDH